MKKYRTTIIALCLIVVALGAFFGARGLGLLDGKEEPTPTPDDVETGAVFSCFDSAGEFYAAVNRIESYSPTEDLVVEKKSGEWTCTSHPEISIISKNVNNALTYMKNLQGRVAYKGEMVYAKVVEFGFEEPEYSVVLKTKTGEEVRVVFGVTNLSTSSCYVWEVGTEVVYLVGTYVQDSCVLKVIDLISSRAFEFADAGQISRIVIEKDGARYAQLNAIISTVVDEPRTWKMAYPLERTGNTTACENLVTALTTIYLNSVEALNCEDLAAYGLAPAKYRVSVTDPHTTITMNIGNLSPDNAYYYVSFGDARDVYLVKTSYINFTDTDLISYIDKYVYMVDYYKLNNVQLEVLGASYDLQYRVTDDSEQFYINGITVVSDSLDCSGEFKHLGAAMYGLRLQGLEAEPAEKGKELCRIRYEQEDGTVVTVVCTERDDATMYFYLNDEYVGGYGNRYLLTSTYENYGITGSIAALFAALGVEDTQN